MTAMIETPRDLLEAVADLRFPPSTDSHMQRLMDRHSEGGLKDEEKQELEALVALSEQMSLLRAQALHVLGRSPL